MFDSEKEINREYKDRLNRNEFANKLADSILNYKSDDSLTMGIIGRWGSGKSSLINLTLEKLKWDKNIIIIHFKPWFFSDQSNLYYQFFKQLISTLKNKEYKNQSFFDQKTKPKRSMFKKSKIENLEDYFNYLNSTEVKFNDNKIFSLDTEDLESFISLENLKNECDEYFDELNCKIIVVIDDIDRLLNSEIKQIFTLVKSLANFKKFIYILSFDNEVVANSLKKLHSDYEYKFIEKIIQIPIRVPDIPSSKILELIIEDIKPIYNQHLANNIFNVEDEFEELLIFLPNFIKNIRDLKRYINMLEFYLNGFVEDINLFDCFLILALQLFEYKTFLTLKNNKTILTRKLKINPSDENNRLNRFYNELEESNESINMQELYNILIYMFPMLKYQYDENYPVPVISELHRKHRIGSEKHFDKYFTFSLETNEISNNELINITKNAPSSFYRILNHQNNEKYNENLFYELNNIITEIPQENCESLIIQLFKLGDDLKILRDTRDNMNSVICKLFKKIESKETRFEIIKKCINFENNVYTSTDYIHKLSVKRKRTGIDIDDLIFLETHLDKIESLILKKITNYAKNDKLFSHRYLTNILDIWKYYEPNRDLIKNYVISKTNNNYELIEFLKKHDISNYEYSLIDEDYMLKNVLEFGPLLKAHYFESLKDEYYDNLLDLNDHIIKLSTDIKTPQNHKKFCRKFIEAFNEYKQSSYEYNDK